MMLHDIFKKYLTGYTYHLQITNEFQINMSDVNSFLACEFMAASWDILGY